MLCAADIIHAAHIALDKLGHTFLSRQVGQGRLIGLHLLLHAGRPGRRSLLSISGNNLGAIQGNGDLAVISRIRHQHRRGHIIACSLDGRHIEFQQELALLHCRPLLHMGSEMLALEVHRVKAHMDKHVNAII